MTPAPTVARQGASDPFRITGPAILNVSGGRTSALMLRRILDAHDGVLPEDVIAVFRGGAEQSEARS